MRQPNLTASDVRVSYGRREAVRGVSLAVGEGEVVSLIGPNGSGKSSLLRALAGRVPAAAGAVSIAGRDLARCTPRERARAAGILEQRNTVPADLTVHELARYGRHPHRRWYEREGTADREAVDWALDHAGMRAHVDRPVAGLSGGEAQRAWLAMALAQRPRVLLLDEPTTYLDIAHQFEVLEVVRALNRTLGIAVLMVLHDLNHAAAFSDRVVALRGGAVLGAGAPDRLFTPGLLSELYGMEAEVASAPAGGPPRIHLIRRGTALAPDRKEPS